MELLASAHVIPYVSLKIEGKPAHCKCHRFAWPRHHRLAIQRRASRQTFFIGMPNLETHHIKGGSFQSCVCEDRGLVANQKFTTNEKAAVCLLRRWTLLRHEKRFTQLAWEAARVLAREPSWVPAQQALAMAECIAQPLACKRARVVVASLFCGKEFAETMRPARENHARWCALQGYTYAPFEDNIAGRDDPTWSKIPHVRQLLRDGAEYVFWMDADSLFMHDGVDLEWACALGKDLVFAGDLNVVFNAGHFLLRRGAWADRFLENAFKVYPSPHWEDNGAMMVVLGGGESERPGTWNDAFQRLKVATRTEQECNFAMTELIPPDIAANVQVVPQHLLNSYEWPGGGGLDAMLRGDLILHFAGCTKPEKIALVAKFASCTGNPSALLRFFAGRGISREASETPSLIGRGI